MCSIGKSKRLSDVGKSITGEVGPGAYGFESAFQKSGPGVTIFSKEIDTRSKLYVDPLLR